MENSSPGNAWSTKLGLLTGPLMIGAGVIALNNSERSPYLAYFIIAMGVIRTCMSAFLYFKQKNQSNNE